MTNRGTGAVMMATCRNYVAWRLTKARASPVLESKNLVVSIIVIVLRKAGVAV